MTHLPDIEGLWVDDSGLDDLLGREDTPGDSVHICGGDVGVHLASLVDGHVCDAGPLLQSLLQALKDLGGGEELDVCLLVHIPAHTPVLSRVCQARKMLLSEGSNANQINTPPV